MIPILLLLAQAAGPAEGADARFERCVALAATAPDRALVEAATWRLTGAGFLARQCEGVAYANQRNFTGAAGALEAAARGAELARDARAANLWAQAGNAWLAAGEPLKAKAALDAALAAGTLVGLSLGEAYLDRARAAVAAGNASAARLDLDRALVSAKDDPLAWLLSATLARRSGDLPRAKADIAEALTRAADDAAVQLEAGNIAALSGDEGAARAAWSRAATLGGTSEVAASARAALAQFKEGR